ncbi:MAG: F0F1 ATP synthase subunit A, partial [Methylomarinum sp.]|nr:F0F1 ATP synthase subunit A [Methylomarinum sp.]
MNEAYFLTVGMLTIHESVITTWGVMLFIISLVWLATRQIKMLPSGVQTVIEAIFETIEQAILEVAPEHGRLIMPFIATLWVFLVITNLVGLIPWLHSPTGDLSVTSALAILVFLSVHWFG